MRNFWSCPGANFPAPLVNVPQPQAHGLTWTFRGISEYLRLKTRRYMPGRTGASPAAPIGWPRAPLLLTSLMRSGSHGRNHGASGRPYVSAGTGVPVGGGVAKAASLLNRGRFRHCHHTEPRRERQKARASPPASTGATVGGRLTTNRTRTSLYFPEIAPFRESLVEGH